MCFLQSGDKMRIYENFPSPLSSLFRCTPTTILYNSIHKAASNIYQRQEVETDFRPTKVSLLNQLSCQSQGRERIQWQFVGCITAHTCHLLTVMCLVRCLICVANQHAGYVRYIGPNKSLICPDCLSRHMRRTLFSVAHASISHSWILIGLSEDLMGYRIEK